MTRHNELRSITLDLESARQQGKWRKLAEHGQSLLLIPDLPDEARSLARGATSDGYFRWDDEEELRSLHYDDLLVPLQGDIPSTIDPADQYWLRGLLQEKRLSYQRRGDWRQIVKDLSTAIELSSMRSEYFFWRASVYGFHGSDYSRALLDCRKAIELDPAKATYFAGQGAIYIAAAATNHPLGDMDKGIADISHAIQLEPTWASLYWMRAQIYRTQEHDDKAIVDERNLCDIDPLLAARFFATRAKENQFHYEKAIHLWFAHF
ncbi:MAG: hypothetical protein KatS3mg050_0702 [Litorilinea sp.]|nr:MAG: hypothetical protein KatS3mg050_0702 [Litorilinea sp.]